MDEEGFQFGSIGLRACDLILSVVEVVPDLDLILLPPFQILVGIKDDADNISLGTQARRPMLPIYLIGILIRCFFAE